MNKALTISFLSHAALLTLIITISFSHSNVMKNIYVVNLVSLPSPTNQITQINQTASLTNETNIPTMTNTKTVNTEQTSEINKNNVSNVGKTFSAENYMKSIESKLTNIEKSFKNRNKVSSNTYSYKSVIPNKPSNNITSMQSFDQTIPPEYFIRIKTIISQHWQIPIENIYSNPAVISFRLWNNGTYSDVILETGSGNINFDNSAIQAIKSVNKFPPFPGNLRTRYFDITVTFTEGGIE